MFFQIETETGEMGQDNNIDTSLEFLNNQTMLRFWLFSIVTKDAILFVYGIWN